MRPNRQGDTVPAVVPHDEDDDLETLLAKVPDATSALTRIPRSAEFQALLNEEAVARMLSRSRKSVKRAVQRGELPPPVRLMGQPSWTVISIRRHFEGRLSEAAKDAERHARRLNGLRPAGAA